MAGMPKTQERFSAMRSNMRALLPILLPVLGSLYGAKIKSTATKQKVDYASLIHLLAF